MNRCQDGTLPASYACWLLTLCRDREHCTILVAGLPESVDKSRIESQFAEVSQSVL